MSPNWILVIIFKHRFDTMLYLDVCYGLCTYCRPPFLGFSLTDFTHMVHAMNQKCVTGIRDKPEETLLHEVMTAPVMSGFWVTEGLQQISLCARCKTHTRQTERQWREQKKKLWTQNGQFFTVTNQVKRQMQRFWCVINTLFGWNLHRLSKTFLVSWTKIFRAIRSLS